MAEIIPGDSVTVSPIVGKVGAIGSGQFLATVLGLPTQQFPYWIFETATAVIYAMDVIVTKQK